MSFSTASSREREEKKTKPFLYNSTACDVKLSMGDGERDDTSIIQLSTSDVQQDSRAFSSTTIQTSPAKRDCDGALPSNAVSNEIRPICAPPLHFASPTTRSQPLLSSYPTSTLSSTLSPTYVHDGPTRGSSCNDRDTPPPSLSHVSSLASQAMFSGGDFDGDILSGTQGLMRGLSVQPTLPASFSSLVPIPASHTAVRQSQ